MDFRNFTTSIVSENQAKLEYHTDLFSCEVNVTLKRTVEKGPTYRLVAFAGNMNYADHRTVYTEVCGLVACADSTIESCSHRAKFQSSVVFDTLSISAVTKTDMIPFAITVDENLLPLSEKSYMFNIQKTPEESSMKMYSEFGIKNLITFTIFQSGWEYYVMSIIFKCKNRRLIGYVSMY